MSNNNNNSNTDNVFVNLSHILLIKIFDHLRDNIDRICFTFVCNRWFNDRHKYFRFNPTPFIGQPKDVYHNFFLKSFKDIFIDSEKQRECSLYLSSNPWAPFTYHRIHKLKIDYTIAKYQELELDENQLAKLLSFTSITHVYGCSVIPKNGFPSNIKFIRFLGFNGSLQPGSFGEGVEKIQFRSKLGCSWSTSKFNEPLVPGVFPDSVTFLSFEYQFDQPIIPRILPPNLKSLKFKYYTFDIDDQALPNTLKHLQISGSPNLKIAIPHQLVSLDINEIYFTDTIRSQIRKLQNLESLSISGGFDFDNNLIKEGDIPKSVTNLTLNCCLENSRSIPLTVKYLDIPQIVYFDEPFPRESQHQFERLTTSVVMKKLILENIMVERFTIPESSGIESIQLESLIENIDCSKIVLPNTIKELILPKYNPCRLTEGFIPNSVETINFGGYINSPASALPKSINTITIQSSAISHYQQSKSITNINFTKRGSVRNIKVSMGKPRVSHQNLNCKVSI
ncbi:hypothetical protein PPL_10467 [Heterostelium album PN500]|uniref:F-box domain-containing protein n=1 Tax=Heterostelium pallidum (strain ATCC 26659 / Pp 5 / PN500) TaxID=670386 RepID=D3BR63_HETP5|nr:hypothetical protein PPL_10467 [Heterostelium album PN500]EFA75895.1 hypothetical protein PPL_10467 [Heterostelium album PN500]|eukprot:XP_020428029.1 hypothetical protein PPL_10467 [Heterostelium album PN500]